MLSDVLRSPPVQTSLRKTPRWTFSIGGAVGVALGVPLASLTLLALLSAVGTGDADAGLTRIVRLSVIFAGLPAFLSGGGVARLVAHRLAEGAPGMRRALPIGVAAMAAAGAGLEILTAVPVGGMPDDRIAWLGVAGTGAISGALTGLAIAALVGMRVARHHRPEEA